MIRAAARRDEVIEDRRAPIVVEDVVQRDDAEPIDRRDR